MSDHFRILVVCTGNICRSAQAEQLIRARISERFTEFESVVLIESAGTGAMVGSGMPAEAATLSAQYGGIPGAHVARQLTVEHVRAADLVLTMTFNHRSTVVRLLPRASRHTFTLVEFAALLENAEQNYSASTVAFIGLEPADKLRSAVRMASARRGYFSLEDGSSAEVVDPYRRSDEVYAESARQIVDAIERSEQAGVRLVERAKV
ncbi:low molecular weight phosphatase family protein [Nesterenkonia sp. CF4.4]|uniref:arsenate reductase/protein-tyrosine-phosphatase family protein n=1 Tax=Nesterenkonia sp. CF4.4 TaxID=3373079 RepID=UPI003EE7893A